MVIALMICGLPHRTSLSYEPYTTELIFILNQKVQQQRPYNVFFNYKKSLNYLFQWNQCGLPRSSSNLMLVSHLVKTLEHSFHDNSLDIA